MAESSYPYDAGSGIAVDEAKWRAMAGRWLPSGVLGASSRDTNDTSLKPSLGSGGAGPTWQMAAGEAWLSGIKYTSDSTLTKTGSANTNSQPRIDRLTLRLDTDTNTCTAYIVQGTPSATPVTPTLPDTATLIHMPIARATCPGSASAQNYSNMVDERCFVGGRIIYGPSTTQGTALTPGGASVQAGDIWVQTDTGRILIYKGTGLGWRGLRAENVNGVPLASTGTYSAAANAQATYAKLDMPAMPYPYEIRFSAHLQLGGLANGAFTFMMIRETNQTNGAIQAQTTEVARGGLLDTPVSLPSSRAIAVPTGAARTWWLTVTPSAACAWVWDDPGNWVSATITPTL